MNGLYYYSAEEYLDGMLQSRTEDWPSLKAGYDAYMAARV